MCVCVSSVLRSCNYSNKCRKVQLENNCNNNKHSTHANVKRKALDSSKRTQLANKQQQQQTQEQQQQQQHKLMAQTTAKHKTNLCR